MKWMDGSRGRRSLGGSAALIGILLGGVAITSPSVARAQDGANLAGPASKESEAQIRSREMRADQLILAELERRRVAIDLSSASDPASRRLVGFLDVRIKLFRSRIERDIEFFRRS